MTEFVLEKDTIHEGKDSLKVINKDKNECLVSKNESKWI